MKVCITCKQEKPLTAFKAYKSRTENAPPLFKNQCKVCTNILSKDSCNCGRLKSAKSKKCDKCTQESYVKDHKVCPECTINKPYSEYRMRIAKGGYKTPKSYCKECEKNIKTLQRQAIIDPVNGYCACGQLKSRRSDKCQDCKWQEFSNKTLGEVLIITGPKFQRYHNIRKLSCRYVKQQYKCCVNCGYDKNFEACHIKAISSFSLDTKISVINAPNNLIALCRNCHWELDHGYLTIAAIEEESWA